MNSMTFFQFWMESSLGRLGVLFSIQWPRVFWSCCLFIVFLTKTVECPMSINVFASRSVRSTDSSDVRACPSGSIEIRKSISDVNRDSFTKISRVLDSDGFRDTDKRFRVLIVLGSKFVC